MIRDSRCVRATLESKSKKRTCHLSVLSARDATRVTLSVGVVGFRSRMINSTRPVQRIRFHRKILMELFFLVAG